LIIISLPINILSPTIYFIQIFMDSNNILIQALQAPISNSAQG